MTTSGHDDDIEPYLPDWLMGSPVPKASASSLDPLFPRFSTPPAISEGVRFSGDTPNSAPGGILRTRSRSRSRSRSLSGSASASSPPNLSLLDLDMASANGLPPPVPSPLPVRSPPAPLGAAGGIEKSFEAAESTWSPSRFRIDKRATSPHRVTFAEPLCTSEGEEDPRSSVNTSARSPAAVSATSFANSIARAGSPGRDGVVTPAAHSSIYPRLNLSSGNADPDSLTDSSSIGLGYGVERRPYSHSHGFRYSPYSRSSQPQNFTLQSSPGARTVRTIRATATWVTVFSYPSDAESYVIEEFAKFGRIAQHLVDRTYNAIHIRYALSLHAYRALEMNGKIMNFAGHKFLIAVSPRYEQLPLSGLKDLSKPMPHTVVSTMMPKLVPIIQQQPTYSSSQHFLHSPSAIRPAHLSRSLTGSFDSKQGVGQGEGFLARFVDWLFS